MQYIKGLDGLRAIAVLLVILSHWYSSNGFIKSLLLGKIGVDIFFVISGFLITKILFHKRIKILNNRKSVFKELKIFIARRTLRIFPIYYCLLVFLYITNGSEFRDVVLYYATYTSNFLFYNTQSWHGFVGHFWSLAVEEQFYLFWPPIIFFFKRKYMFPFLLITVVLGTLYPFFMSKNMTSILTLSCVNAFSVGALLSYVMVFKPKFKEQFKKVVKHSFLPLLISLMVHLLIVRMGYFPFRLVVSLLSLRLILLCVEEPKGNFMFKILNLKVLSFIGSISYGIYLYHNFIPSYFNRIFRVLKIEQPEFLSSNIRNVLFFMILILISYLSWVCIEKPFLKLKSKIK